MKVHVLILENWHAVLLLQKYKIYLTDNDNISHFPPRSITARRLWSVSFFTRSNLLNIRCSYRGRRGGVITPPPSLRILLLQPTFEKESEENLTSGIMNSCKPTTPATVNVLWRRLPCLVRMKLLKVYSTDNNPHILTVIRIRRLSMTTALTKRHVDARHWSKMSSKR